LAALAGLRGVPAWWPFGKSGRKPARATKPGQARKRKKGEPPAREGPARPLPQRRRQVYVVPGKRARRLERAMDDDRLGRASLHVVDARHFGEAGDHFYFFVAGLDTDILRADALVLEWATRAENAYELWQKWDDENERAAYNIGTLFGADEDRALPTPADPGLPRTPPLEDGND